MAKQTFLKLLRHVDHDIPVLIQMPNTSHPYPIPDDDHSLVETSK